MHIIFPYILRTWDKILTAYKLTPLHDTTLFCLLILSFLRKNVTFTQNWRVLAKSNTNYWNNVCPTLVAVIIAAASAVVVLWVTGFTHLVIVGAAEEFLRRDRRPTFNTTLLFLSQISQGLQFLLLSEVFVVFDAQNVFIYFVGFKNVFPQLSDRHLDVLLWHVLIPRLKVFELSKVGPLFVQNLDGNL